MANSLPTSSNFGHLYRYYEVRSKYRHLRPHCRGLCQLPYLMVFYIAMVVMQKHKVDPQYSCIFIEQDKWPLFWFLPLITCPLI